MSAIIRAHINRFYLQVAVDFNIMKLPSDTSDKSMKMQRLLVRISWFIVLMWLLRAHSTLLQNRSSLGIQFIRAGDFIDCDKTLDQYWSRKKYSTLIFKLDFMPSLSSVQLYNSLTVFNAIWMLSPYSAKRGTSDPYVKASIVTPTATGAEMQHLSCRTEYKPRTLDPIWYVLF